MTCSASSAGTFGGSGAGSALDLRVLRGEVGAVVVAARERQLARSIAWYAVAPSPHTSAGGPIPPNSSGSHCSGGM